ncbi:MULTISPECIES: VWA domain-containing protein [unclassified Oceanobacter]|uniref:VWA domain-containing protein n=1 Tax=unclassified Oceanobacter TaxID=2620260 RepID=UPI0027326EA0|nr:MULTISPECIES: VWA domain-containing protein [unclassified Oceanobacter]MDP2607465.1 VWA domain-containing protein [Oceanobacter sp. 1_MG-2023]MDP2610733.1 VWA domain-containing protein [Oceanobacter sp. 2_MG-2023]
MTSFHFLRPEWLWLLLPAALLLWQNHRRQLQSGQWQTLMDPQLLDYMVEQQPAQGRRPGLIWLALGWLLATLAMAGPSWEKLPQPVYKNQHILVILLDMSYSMAAQDIKPSRAERALQKITDILNSRRDGQTALITYAGDAHTVTPVTNDSGTIANLLPALSPFIMPSPGSRPDRAIELAQQLVQDSGYQRADLLLITDGIQPRDVDRIQQVLDQRHFHLGVISLGSPQGAPIPLPSGGFLQDSNGSIVLPGLDTRPLDALQQQLGIPWHAISLLDDDWQAVTPAAATPDSHTNPEAKHPDQNNSLNHSQSQPSFDRWLDEGFWLLLIILPLALAGFRRGVLSSWCLVLLLPLGLLSSPPGYAETTTDSSANTGSRWQDWWSTPDQQGARLLDTDPAAAASKFEDPAWRGTAAYRAGDYQAAVDAFANDPSATGHYNLGNALAQQGRYEDALAAYDNALQQQPDMEDARKNREIVAQALKQQQDQQDQESQDQQQDQDNQGQQQDQQDQQNQQGQNGQDQPSSDSSSKNADQSGEPSSEPQQSSEQPSEQSPSDADNDGQSDQQPGQDQQPSQESSPEDADDQTSDDQTNKDQANNDTPANNQAPQRALGDIPSDSLEHLSPEEQASLRQWLNRVPDQPGQLLQRKFLYQYSQQSKDQPPEDVLW